MTPADHAVALELNNAAVPAVNAHDEQSWADLLTMADRAWVVDDGGVIGALLVTFGPGADYESRNYGWLSDRYGDFGYVDRIVVAPTHRRRGLAGLLYDAFASHAAGQGRPCLLCEVNVEPPNPQSMAFHEANGWHSVGELQHEPGKVVRFFERPLVA